MFLNFTIESFKFTSSINKNKMYSYVQQITLILGDILLFCGMIFGIVQTPELVYLSTILALFICSGYVFAVRNLSKMYQKLLLKIISTVLATNLDWPDFVDRKIAGEAEIRTERNSMVEVVLIFFSITFCLYCPYFYFIAKPDITFDHPDLEIIPSFYPFWKTKTFLQHSAKLFFQGLLGFSSIGGHLTFTAFMMYAITNLKTHIEEINRLLRCAIDCQVERYMTLEEWQTSGFNYESYMFRKFSKNAKREFARSVEKEMIKIIKYHQFIHGYIKDMTTFLRIPFSLFFTWFVSSTILFVFVGLQINNDCIFIAKISSLVMHGILALHVYCDAAQTIYETNESIMDSFYSTSWYYLPLKARKNLICILTLCQRRYQMKCFGMYVINLNFFIYAMRTVYSAINIIRAAQKK